jgi:hypothetical protein
MEKRLRSAELLPEADASLILQLPVGAEEPEEDAVEEQTDDADEPTL